MVQKIKGGERFRVEYNYIGTGKGANIVSQTRERRVRVRGQSLLSIKEETEGERRDKEV